MDEFGLVAALRQQSRGLGRPDCQGLSVDFVVEEELPPLPAVVEVAAYRIVMEALTNVARHCASGQATVTLEVSPENRFVIEVADTGSSVASWRPGVGMTSMAERVTELGGTFSAGPGSHGGRVRAVLPLGV